MPIKSKAQQRLMYAAAEGKVKDGPSKAVAKKYIEETPKKAFGKMPEKKKLVMKKKGAC